MIYIMMMMGHNKNQRAVFIRAVLVAPDSDGRNCDLLVAGWVDFIRVSEMRGKMFQVS